MDHIANEAQTEPTDGTIVQVWDLAADRDWSVRVKMMLTELGKPVILEVVRLDEPHG